jgi:hypothetical protein
MYQPQISANISQLLEATISPDTAIIKQVCSLSPAGRASEPGSDLTT